MTAIAKRHQPYNNQTATTLSNDNGHEVTWQKATSLGSCRYLLPYSPGDSSRREVGHWVCIWNPILGEGEVVGVADGTIRKSDGGFLYRLFIVTVALSVTIRLQFAVECLRRSSNRRVGHFGSKFWEERVGGT